MLRLGFGLVLAGLVATAQAAQSDEDFFAPQIKLLTTQFAHSGTDFSPPYQFSASVVLTRSPDTAPTGLGLGSTFAKPQAEIIRAINSHRPQTYNDTRISLPRLFRIEFKVEQLNIALRPRSVSIDGGRLKITLRPQSALIEEERLKLILQPHSTSMLWSTAF